jgi:hypothetical protein
MGEFIRWLTETRRLQPSTAAARASNCATVERAYGTKLDALTKERFSQLIEEFVYSATDQREVRAVKHRVSINGDQYTGTATLRSALKLYFSFRFQHDPAGRPSRPSPNPNPSTSPSGNWPEWEPPSEEDSLLLAEVLARHTRFLKPDIVRAVVEDNAQRAAGWRAELTALGITADAYLWDGSPCAFPGVRRYAGSDEIAIHRRRKLNDGKRPADALALDDNDYPKQLWSHLYLGKAFPKHGPKGYNLAHLADHKVHNNRAGEDFEITSGAPSERRLHGLYTCPTNTVYVPAGLLKPTDFHVAVRGLFLRRAQALYGSFCSIVPPFMSLRVNDNAHWDISRFDWAQPVGDSTGMSLFLNFRARRMDELFARSPVEPA